MAFIASRRALLSPTWEPASLGSWAPTDLGASLIAWWDAGSGVTESGGAVSAWADSVGALTVAQGTAGNKPTYSATSFRGAPGITFDGTDDYLSVASTGSLPSGGNACEIWALVDQTALVADTNNRFILSFGSVNSTARRTLYRRVSGGANEARGDIGNGSAATSINFTGLADFSGPNVVRLAVGASSSRGQINGGPFTATFTVTPNTTTAITAIGANGALTGTQLWQGQIAAILVTGALTIDQAKYLTAYLTRRAFG